MLNISKQIKNIFTVVAFLGLVSAQSVVTFDIDGVDDCGFVSINGSFPDDAGAAWSGWGAHTDNGMQQTVASGSYEFQVLCVDTSINEWWNNIVGASTVLTAPLGSECDFNPTDEWNNYGFTVDGSGDAVTVSYCAGSCDATCGGDTDISGCLDPNATNYNPDATIQEEDQWGNLVCIYASCDDTPGDGCMYADGWGAFNDSFDAAACSSYGGTPCETATADVYGCLDPNATNYDPNATDQLLDQYGNLVCIYASCDDVPYDGCMYADAFAGWFPGFGPVECTMYGGTPCEESTTATVEFSADMNSVDQPSADYDSVVINGSWNGWGGWGVQLFDDDGDGVFTGSAEFDALSSFEYVVAVTGAADGWSGWGMQWGQCDGTNFSVTVGAAGSTTASSSAPGDCGGGDLSSVVTFDIDGVDECGFLSVTGTWDGWSGWGAHTDSGMAADIPAGDHEFVILCVNTEGEWWNDIWGSSTVYNAPIDGSCWNGNSEYPNYVLNVDGSGDAVTVSYCAGSCEETCSDDECTMGDVNGDGDVNVLDIIQIVGYVISGTADFDLACADSNGDGVVNILDIVALVSDILGGRVDILDATTGKLIRDYGALMLKANGYIGGVQMTLKHGADFTIELTDNALVADSRTVGNETKLVIVVPGSEELFTFTGDFDILDMIVANSSERVNVTAPTAFSLSEAYPNPFNPTTSMTLAVPVAGNVSVQVYNIMGQVVATLASGHMDASTYNLTWDASNVSSGMYFIKAEAAGSVTTQKLVLMK